MHDDHAYQSFLSKLFKKYPQITNEQEKELVLEYVRTKDRRISEKIIMGNARYIAYVANVFAKRYGVRREDCFQEGIGTMQNVIDKLDPALMYTHERATVTAYAKWYVVVSMQRFIEKSYISVSLSNPYGRAALFYKKEKRKGVIERDLRFGAEEFDFSYDDVSNTMENTVHDEVADAEANKVFKEFFEQVDKSLNEKQSAILKERLLQHKEDGLKLEELGDKFGLSRERIRQIEEQLLTTIKNKAKSKGLRDSL
jgi:RNA polymerase sigma-32 factor